MHRSKRETQKALGSTKPRLRTSSTFDPSAIQLAAAMSASTSEEVGREEEDAAPHWSSHFIRCEMPADGDCLFSSISEILNRMSPEHKTIVQSYMASIGLTVPTVDLLAKNPDLVRLLSVCSVRTDSPVVKNIISTWRVLYANALREGNRELLTEYRHMSCLNGVTEEELSPVHLSALFSSMRQKSTYWGNEFDLRMLEEYLGVHFIVVSNEGKVQYMPMEHEPAFEPNLFCLLYRREWPGDMPHYQGLKYAETGAMSFTKEELPREIIDMCQCDLGGGTDTPWYISLAGL